MPSAQVSTSSLQNHSYSMLACISVDRAKSSQSYSLDTTKRTVLAVKSTLKDGTKKCQVLSACWTLTKLINRSFKGSGHYVSLYINLSLKPLCEEFGQPDNPKS